MLYSLTHSTKQPCCIISLLVVPLFGMRSELTCYPFSGFPMCSSKKLLLNRNPAPRCTKKKILKKTDAHIRRNVRISVCKKKAVAFSSIYFKEKREPIYWRGGRAALWQVWAFHSPWSCAPLRSGAGDPCAGPFGLGLGG